MEVLEKIQQLRQHMGWTEYRLSEESGIAQSTISSWFRKGLLPSVGSLKSVCKAFGITLSQFFALDEQPVALSDTQRELLHYWGKLSEKQQEQLMLFLKSL